MTRTPATPATITVHVPLQWVKRGGRKQMVLPAGGEGQQDPAPANSAVVKALARAFRWKRMLETGEFATLGELAAREALSPSYMTRLLQLTLLAPDVVEAILDGKEGSDMTLAGLREPIPVEWRKQKF